MTDFDSIYKYAKHFFKQANEGEFWLSDEGDLEPAPLKKIEPFEYRKDRDSKEILHTVGDEGDLLVIDDTIFVWKLDNETKARVLDYAAGLPEGSELKVEETSTGKELSISDLESEPAAKLASVAASLEKKILKKKLNKSAQNSAAPTISQNSIEDALYNAGLSPWVNPPSSDAAVEINYNSPFFMKFVNPALDTLPDGTKITVVVRANGDVVTKPSSFVKQPTMQLFAKSVKNLAVKGSADAILIKDYG